MFINKYLKSCFLLFTILAHANLQAQDSLYFDLGRVKLKKSFTQNISIKADDLQKMPFTNLSEAINVWLKGVYTNSDNLVYIIDGNIANDVNAYSIYDIEEITLVQNSIAKISGANDNLNTVLITTKTRTGKSGVEYAANLNNTLTSKHSQFYQLYVGGFKNTKKTHSGVSANFLYDENLGSFGNGKVNEINRFRFRAYSKIK